MLVSVVGNLQSKNLFVNNYMHRKLNNNISECKQWNNSFIIGW